MRINAFLSLVECDSMTNLDLSAKPPHILSRFCYQGGACNGDAFYFVISAIQILV